jgi:hypothetical protein
MLSQVIIQRLLIAHFPFQVNLNGLALHESKENLDAFYIQVRSTLASSLPSPRCYYWLTLIVDITHYGWSVQGLPDFLKKFYSEKLGGPFAQLAAVAPRSPPKVELRNTVTRINDDGK